MSGEAYEKYVQKGTPWWKTVVNIIFSNIGLLFLVVGFCVAGSFIFMKLEEPREEEARIAKMQKTEDVEAAIEYLKYQFWDYGVNEEKYNFTRQEYKKAVMDDLKALERYILDACDTYGYDTTTDFERDFTFDKTLLFTLTIISTIGYGHITPGTAEAKLFCIGYALVGLPLLLVFMAQIGDWMAKAFRWTYSRVLCRWCRVRRRDSELPPEIDRREMGIRVDEVGKERYMPTDLVMVPITVNLMLIFIFIFMGSIIFTVSEGWDPMTSAYFCFVTLTTIGFGDYTPVNSFRGFETDVVALMMMIFSTWYIVFGMTLLSMCLNLMQDQIIEKVTWLVHALGGGGSSDEEVIKLSKPEKVTETPEDKKGTLKEERKKEKKMMKQKAKEEEDMRRQYYEDSRNDPEMGNDNVAFINEEEIDDQSGQYYAE